MAQKITKTEAKKLAQKMGINFSKDFFELSISDKDALVKIAKLQGYKKSKSASGSTGRCYFEYLNKK